MSRPTCEECGAALIPIEDDDHGVVGGYCRNTCMQCDCHKDVDGDCPNKCDDECPICGAPIEQCICDTF